MSQTILLFAKQVQKTNCQTTFADKFVFIIKYKNLEFGKNVVELKNKL